MKTTIYAIYLSLAATLLFSCGNSKDGMGSNENNTENAQVIAKKLSDFTAEAPDSSWILRVQFDNQVYFEDISRGIKFSGNVDELHVAQGADVVGISAKNNTHVLRLSIDIVDCGNGGKNVDIMLRKKDKKDGTNYSSCGYYRGNPKLHDIWAVEAINGEELNADKFPKDIPHFEINLETKHFGGFAGCNQVNGQMKFEYNKVTIAPLASTKMYCADISDIENKILNILRSGAVIYTLKSGKLILENQTGSLTLKNVD